MDEAGVSFYLEKCLKVRKSIQDAEIHARKMGLDEGQIINRDEFERLMFAMGFWMLRGVDLDLKHLAPKLLELHFVEEAYGVLDRYFVRTRFLSAFSKSITQESGVSLPLWCYEILKATVDTFWETDALDPDDVKAYESFEAGIRAKMEGVAKSA